MVLAHNWANPGPTRGQSPNRPKPVTTPRTQQNQQHTTKTTPKTLTTRATLAAVEGGATLDGA
jgi:hypothetical protein